jgi:ferredoxin-NADP reductase
LFHVDEKHENKIFYVNEALGDFTLEQRTEGCDHVIMVATGTGVAPFISMLRQLHHEALEGKPSKQRFTLFYSNRSLKELGYHDELTNIERERRFDFVYVPSLSRPTEKDYRNIVLGRGRVTDLLRLVFRLPKNIAGIKKDKAWSSLPKHIEVSELRKRMPAERSVILACGNDEAVAQVERIAKDAKIRCEKEKW